MTAPNHQVKPRPASVMTRDEALAAIEAIRAIQEGGNAYRAKQVSHHQARAQRICRAYDERRDLDAIARDEEISKPRVINILMQNGRAQPKPVQPVAAALPAIRGASAPHDNAGVAIKHQTQDFAKALLAHMVRRDILPEGLTLPAFVGRCRQHGVFVPPELIEAVDAHCQQAVAA